MDDTLPAMTASLHEIKHNYVEVFSVLHICDICAWTGKHTIFSYRRVPTFQTRLHEDTASI